ncbi:hypothetical protein ES703_80931 [subsurface metagenome]
MNPEWLMKKKNPLKFLCVTITIICIWLAIFCCTGQAQEKDKKPGLFIGVGGGFGTVTEPEYLRKISDRGINLKFQVGLRKSSGALIMIEYEVHHIKDETPELSEIDYNNRPRHFKTCFLLATYEIYLIKGFFLRPSFGLRKENELLLRKWDYTVYPPRCIDTEISREIFLAWGISVGYEYKLTRHIGVALEAVARGCINYPDMEGSGGQSSPRRAFGIQAVGIWYF